MHIVFPLLGFCLLLLPSVSDACQVQLGSEWRRLTIEESLRAPRLVVYAKHVERLDNPDGVHYDAKLQVYCVLKNKLSGNRTIPEFIVVEKVDDNTRIPRCDSTHTWVGKQMIAALRRSKTGNFWWHEVGHYQRANFMPSFCNFQRILEEYRLLFPKDFVAPAGRSADDEPGCPNPEDYKEDRKQFGWL